jgi:hypothetical protein
VRACSGCKCNPAAGLAELGYKPSRPIKPESVLNSSVTISFSRRPMSFIVRIFSNHAVLEGKNGQAKSRKKP